MYVHWIALSTGAVLLFGAAGASAQQRVLLTNLQLDAITPLSRYQPGEYQLRVTVDRFTGVNRDRTRDAILQEEIDEETAQQEAPAPAGQGTPARRALLAAGSSDAWSSTAAYERELALAAPASHESHTVNSGSRPSLATLRTPVATSTMPTSTVSSRSQPDATWARSGASDRRVASPARQTPRIASQVPHADLAPDRPRPAVRPARMSNSLSGVGERIGRIQSEVSRTIGAIQSQTLGMPR